MSAAGKSTGPAINPAASGIDGADMAAHSLAHALPDGAADASRIGARVSAIAPAERRERIERMVRDHHAFVCRSTRRLGVREADVDDAVQEIFLTAVKHLDEIVPGSERGYLFRTCAFVSAHARRSVQRRREVVDEARVNAEVDKRLSPEQHAVRSQARARLQAILDQMPDGFGEVFVLFELERRTMVEIAEMLNLPQGTVASRLRRAREIFLTQGTNVAPAGEGA